MTETAIKVIRLQTLASYVFAADNIRARAPFDQERGVELAKSFSTADFVVQPSERPVWAARQGTCKFSDQRRVLCTALLGTAHEVSAAVEGPTEDAKDVLAELWTKLGELVGDDPRDITDFPGAFAYSTTAVVEVRDGFVAAFAGIPMLRRFARDRLGEAFVQRDDAQQFRIEVPIEMGVRGLSVRRSIVIEPRFTARPEDRVFFTVSPLMSSDHVEMLESLCMIASSSRPSVTLVAPSPPVRKPIPTE